MDVVVNQNKGWMISLQRRGEGGDRFSGRRRKDLPYPVNALSVTARLNLVAGRSAPDPGTPDNYIPLDLLYIRESRANFGYLISTIGQEIELK